MAAPTACFEDAFPARRFTPAPPAYLLHNKPSAWLQPSPIVPQPVLAEAEARGVTIHYLDAGALRLMIRQKTRLRHYFRQVATIFTTHFS